MKRSKFNLSNYRLLTGDMGFLYPCQVQEILPGDSIQASSSALIRVNPLLAPVMHPVTVRIHHWFVPNRHTWTDGDGWEEFITGGKDGTDQQTVPKIAHLGQPGQLPDYMGIPNTPGILINSLPIAAVNLIFNEWYRDQDLVDERTLTDVTVPQCAWEKDYLTTSRPTPQKGPDITVPLGDRAPVRGIGTQPDVAFNQIDENARESFGVDTMYDTSHGMNQNSPGYGMVQEDPENPGYPLVYADLTEATAANVNDWRRAFALQRYQEARSRYGSRYTEYLKYIGVNPADSRLQRPEYLGGGKTTINFSEVLQTAPDQDSSVGELKGHGIAAVRTRPFVRHFNEHGYYISLISARPKTIYQDGVPRTFLRETKEDYWQPELQAIGQQPVLNNEVYADNAAGSETFGWQDRYAEYKRTLSGVSGEFRDILDHWHMARKFESAPALNSEFVSCDATKRIHSTQEDHALWCMVQNNVRARRMVKKSAANRIL